MSKVNKMSNGALQLLNDAITVATILGIERVVIDNHSLRGESQDNGTMLLFPFPQGTELEFGAMGISRVPVLRARMRLLGDEGIVTPEYKVRDSGEKFIFRLGLSKSRTKIDFKCADPAQIRAPKAFNDPEHFGFSVSAEDITMMLAAKTAMQADTVSFISSDSKTVSYSVHASEGDVLAHELDTSLDIKEDVDTFTFSYKTKILFPVLKEIMDVAKDGNVDIVITRRGILKIEVKDIPIYVFPEV